MPVAVVLLCILMVLFSVATFVENDFGTMIAKHYFYLAVWTKVIWVLLIFNLVGIFFKHKLFRFRKIHVTCFHSGFIVLLIGAFITHIFGYEGTMMIANGQTVNSMITQHHEFTATQKTNRDSTSYKTFWNLHQDKTKPVVTFNNAELYFNSVKENMGLQFVFKRPQHIQNLLLSPIQDSTTMTNKFYGTLTIEDTTYTFSYAPQQIPLPFSIRLDSFNMERYPGSQSPSSFSSYVHITEGKNSYPYHIYMNNILSVQGYRIYQSSYFKNEQGTILTVNNDFWGTTITYAGYMLLLLGFLMTLFNRYSYLRKTVIRKSILSVALFLCIFSVRAQSTDSIPSIDSKHVEKYGQLYIQNFKGRIQTIHTFGLEVLRKISRKDHLDKFSPDEFILSVTLYPMKWWAVPVIKVDNPQLQKVLQIEENYAALNHFFDIDQNYSINNYIYEAQNKKPALRTNFDKEVLKVNERVNIFYQLIMGNAFKILPSPYKDSPNWLSPTECQFFNDSTPDVNFVKHIYPYYLSMVEQASEGQETYKESADYLLSGIAMYQEKMSTVELPTKTYAQIELWYQKIDIFWRLFPFFATCGIVMLFVIIYGIIRNRPTSVIYRWLQGLVIAGFVLQTFGLAIRWYLSGHPPMSNAFETLVYVSWCIILIGIFFTRKSPLIAAIATFCGALPLLVAHLNMMDPEITPLVPVLQSTWLLIHVSVITSSYGFFAIMALISIVFFTLTLFIHQNNRLQVEEAIYKITIISNKVAILGLGLLTIGTFMGAVWANQSWGRYWGWDPKETWSLITMLCYAVVVHSRFIKPLNSIFVYHTLSLFAFASVLMTYFGVNFYLSGLHSYASGDPLTLPFYIYIIIAVILLMIVGSYLKLKKQGKKVL